MDDASHTPQPAEPEYAEFRLVIVGDPIDGYRYYGPFPSACSAQRWVDQNVDHCDYWITDLFFPVPAGDEGEQSGES